MASLITALWKQQFPRSRWRRLIFNREHTPSLALRVRVHDFATVASIKVDSRHSFGKITNPLRSFVEITNLRRVFNPRKRHRTLNVSPESCIFPSRHVNLARWRNEACNLPRNRYDLAQLLP